MKKSFKSCLIEVLKKDKELYTWLFDTIIFGTIIGCIFGLFIEFMMLHIVSLNTFIIGVFGGVGFLILLAGMLLKATIKEYNKK